jgi:dedicator of cytokinesis protein 9/10/11
LTQRDNKPVGATSVPRPCLHADHSPLFRVQVDTKDLDPRFAYIQVTHVTPYFDDKELVDRQTDFERNNNIRRFMFETPFTKDGRTHGDIENQWRRRTVITS